MSAPLNSTVISNSITIAGIDVAAPIAVVAGEYSVDGGAFTDTAGSVINGQSVRVRQEVSFNRFERSVTSLTIGGVQGDFTVYTLGVDATLTILASNRLHFSWTDGLDATHYRLLENPNGASGFTQVSDNILPGDEQYEHNIELYLRNNAQYRLQTCDNESCSLSSNIQVSNHIPQRAGVPGAVRDSNESCIPPEPVVVDASVGVESAFPNLPLIVAPLGMVQPPNDSSFWLLLQRDGHVYRFDNNEAANALTTVLDISGKILTSGEFGLTGLAIHPNYPSDARVFLLFNDPSLNGMAGRSVIASYTINTSTQMIDPASEIELLVLDQPDIFHNGGDLTFGIDGMLYAAFGDSERDQESQNRQNLLGSMIRINVNTQPYSIPPDNPFNIDQSRCNVSDSLRVETCPEIFAYGLRNPWRFSIDSATGIPWVGDVGDSLREETDRIVSGGNYGWPEMEGTLCGGGDCEGKGYLPPITDHTRSEMVSIVGGYVYRGTRSPNLIGQYIYGDVFTGRFFSVDVGATAGTSPTSQFSSPVGQVFAMAQGNDGEVYLLGANTEFVGEMIQRVVGNGGTEITMPANLADTGCFNTATKRSAQGVFDYTINAALWTDGANKERAFSLPNGASINVQSDGDYVFPVNTILMKHFLNGTTYLETRLLIRHSTGWAGYSYEWNDAQTNAVLLDDGKTKDVGGYVHIYPSPAQCLQCHVSAANDALGPEHSQFNHVSDELGSNLINYLNSAGYFSSGQLYWEQPSLYALNDETASLAQRARSYLHSNCSGCHRPGSAFSGMDFRFSTPLADTGACDIAPSAGTLGIAGARRIAPGLPERSVVLARMETLNGSDRMPPLGTLAEDTDATLLIGQWISGLSGCL